MATITINNNKNNNNNNNNITADVSVTGTKAALIPCNTLMDVNPAAILVPMPMPIRLGFRARVMASISRAGSWPEVGAFGSEVNGRTRASHYSKDPPPLRV